MNLICNWCGTKLETYKDGVNWQNEIICEHCWNWIMLEADKKQKEQEKHFFVEDDIIADETTKKI